MIDWTKLREFFGQTEPLFFGGDGAAEASDGALTGRQIAERRKLLGLRQTDLARMAGLTKGQVNSIENEIAKDNVERRLLLTRVLQEAQEDELDY